MKKYADQRISEIPVTGIDSEAERLFHEYGWPGNVRELENVIERTMILCPDSIIKPSDLPKDFKETMNYKIPLEDIPATAKLYDTLAMVEKRMIERALQRTNYVQSHAAEMLGIGKSGLNQKIKKYQLDSRIKQ